MRKVLAALCCCLIAPFAQAQSYSVALPDITPHSFTAPDGRKLGLYVDLIKLIGERAGVELQLNIVPFARAVQMMNEGETDLAVLKHSVVQASKTQNLGHLHTINLVLWPRPGLQINEAKELEGKTVGRLRSSCQELFTLTNPAFFEINHFEQGVRMLNVARLDALCGSRDAILFEIRRTSSTSLEFGQPLLLKQIEINLLAKNTLPSDVAKRLERATAEVMRSDAKQKILARYGLN